MQSYRHIQNKFVLFRKMGNAPDPRQNKFVLFRKMGNAPGPRQNKFVLFRKKQNHQKAYPAKFVLFRKTDNAHDPRRNKFVLFRKKQNHQKVHPAKFVLFRKTDNAHDPRQNKFVLFCKIAIRATGSEPALQYNSHLGQNMPELKIRPSAKLLFPLYLLAIALAIAIEVYRKQADPTLVYLQAIPVFLFLWTVVRHLRLTFTTLAVSGGKLRYQSGVLSRSTRTMEIKKVQDVRVDQTLGQRILGMGDISIETAGETSRLTMQSIDRPQVIADAILEAAHKAV